MELKTLNDFLKASDIWDAFWHDGVLWVKHFHKLQGDIYKVNEEFYILNDKVNCVEQLKNTETVKAIDFSKYDDGTYIFYTSRGEAIDNLKKNLRQRLDTSHLLIEGLKAQIDDLKNGLDAVDNVI